MKDRVGDGKLIIIIIMTVSALFRDSDQCIRSTVDEFC